jgi:transposase
MINVARPLALKRGQKRALQALVKSGKTPQKVAVRARIVLFAAAGRSHSEIARQLEISRPTVLLWRERFEREGVTSLLRDAARPGRQKAIAPEVVQRVVEATLHTTPPQATHWSVRSMAKAQGLSRMTVHRIWQQHRLQPHRVESFKLSRDPFFVEKLRDIVGLYLNPPDKALVLSVDEKSQIQALDRTQPILPLRPGIAARQTHDYRRHGTTTLFTALSLLDGTVIGACQPRHRSEEFIRFLHKVDRETPPALDLHLIVDNYGAHKTAKVKKWLESHPRFQLHFTPTGSSWLNLVETWFSQITQKRLRRGTFTSVKQLITAIDDYIRNYNTNPTLFRWTKDADMILGKVNRCKEALGTPH